MQESTWNRLGRATPWILVVVLGITNSILLRQNGAIRQQLKRVVPEVLQEGDRVSAFTARNIGGDLVAITYSGRGPKRVLLYFTPTCKFCIQQFPYWREVISQANSEQFEVIGLVTDLEDITKLQRFLTEMKCSPESATPLRVVLVSGEVLRSYKLSPTPLTLIVSNNGIVEKAWVGLWDAANISAASSTLGITISSN